MLKFNDLRVFTDLRHCFNGKYLIIDVSVDTADYYNDLNISRIAIDNQKTYISFDYASSNAVEVYGPASTKIPVYVHSGECHCSPVLDESMTYCYVDGEQLVKNVRVRISAEELLVQGIDIDNDFMLVYVTVDGTPPPEAPCCNGTNVAAVVNIHKIYDKAMFFIKEIGDDCQIPRGFTNWILQYKALELCIKSGDYSKAMEHWEFIKKNNSKSISSNCKCNGSY